MSHLHDFVGVTGPRKILTFVTGPFLKLTEYPWSTGFLNSSGFCCRFLLRYFELHALTM